MELRHLLVITILFLSASAFAKQKELAADPTFNDPPTNPVTESATEVSIKPNQGKALEEEINMSDEETRPRRIIKEQPLPDTTPATFTVRTVRINSQKPAARYIQLLGPPHNSTFTPGVIAFTWKINTNSKKKKSVILRVERLDGQRKFAKKTKREKRLLDLSPGDYKWQVAIDKNQESKWRLLKVIGVKSHSLTELYNGQVPGKKATTKKTKDEVGMYIIDADTPEADEEETPRYQSSNMASTSRPAPVTRQRQEPAPISPMAPPPAPPPSKPAPAGESLEAPSWVKPHPSSSN